MESGVTFTINCNYRKAELFITYKHDLFQVYNSNIFNKIHKHNNNIASINGYFYFH
jgi:hypothetical protein